MPKTFIFKEKRYIDLQTVPAGVPFTTSAFDKIKPPKGAIEVKSESGQPVQDDDKINATKSAIKLAMQHTIDLNQVGGTGENGRITKEDVESYIEGTAPKDMVS